MAPPAAAPYSPPGGTGWIARPNACAGGQLPSLIIVTFPPIHVCPRPGACTVFWVVWYHACSSLDATLL